jgi:hypothetical protein
LCFPEYRSRHDFLEKELEAILELEKELDDKDNEGKLMVCKRLCWLE